MTWINKIAYHQGVRGEEPNKALASELANTNQIEGIKEISEFLYDENKSISSDCLAVLYTIGYTKPELIEPYLETFLDLLKSKNNRMVWGAMIGLSSIAKIKPSELYEKRDLLMETMQKGTLITEIWGIKTLANIVRADESYEEDILPVLFDYLEKCRPLDFVSRVEVLFPVMNTEIKKAVFNQIIEIKREELSPSQLKKLQSTINKQTKLLNSK